MIIGQPGAGKSTLARILGEKLDLPIVHIDLIHWQAGWTERPTAEKSQMCHEVHMRDSWIFEGGHSRTWDERLSRADTLIWLDFPLHIRAWRVIKRTLQHYGQSRPDLPENCPERFDWEFTTWIWQTRKTGREKMHRFYFAAPVDKIKVRLQTSTQVQMFLSRLDIEPLQSYH